MSKPRPYQIVRPLTTKERADLKASIEQNGILVPIIVDEEGHIIDGHSRAELAEELGIECPREVRANLTELQKLELAEILNSHRRQMTAEDLQATNEAKREKVAAYLREHPQASARAVEEAVGVSKTVAAQVKNELKQSGELSGADSSVGRDGKVRRAPRREPTQKSKPPEKEETETAEDSKQWERLATRIGALDFSVRTLNYLLKAGISTVGDLVQKTEEELFNLENWGRKSMLEVRAKLAGLGLSLSGTPIAELPEDEVEEAPPSEPAGTARDYWNLVEESLRDLTLPGVVDEWRRLVSEEEQPEWSWERARPFLARHGMELEGGRSPSELQLLSWLVTWFQREDVVWLAKAVAKDTGKDICGR